MLLCIFSLVFLLLVPQNPRGSESVSEKIENCPALGDEISNSGECTEILEQQIVAMKGTSNLCQEMIHLKFLRLMEQVQSSLHHSCIIRHDC